jgi:hypothetical protein
MRLAEALIIRADYAKRIAQLRQRIAANAKVQEGNDPPESPGELIDEVTRIVNDLVGMIRKINIKNSSTDLEPGLTIADAIAVRDGLKIKQAIYRESANAGVVTQDRYSKSEVEFKSTVDIAALQKQADSFALEYRDLDAKIQEANWQTELKE